jgi:Interleukin-like EMT inducer
MDTAPHTGYIAINSNSVINTNYRGFNLVELNVSSCLSTNIRHFDTWASTVDSDNMATYINSLPLNTVLIGVTADEASFSLTQNARSALLSIGVNVTGLQYHGKVAFLTKIGQPSITMAQVSPAGGNNLKLNVNVSGTP